MKKIIKIFSLLFLITITFTGCKSSDESDAHKIAQEFGINLYTVDTQKVNDYKQVVLFSEKENVKDLIGPDGTIKAKKETQEKYIQMMQSLDKDIQPLMTEKGHEYIIGNRHNTLSAEVCAKGNYTLQVTDIILEKNLYGEKEDKAGYYYEAKLKFNSADGKDARTDTAKGYIGLIKENGQWKVSIYQSKEYPKLYKEVLPNKL